MASNWIEENFLFMNNHTQTLLLGLLNHFYHVQLRCWIWKKRNWQQEKKMNILLEIFNRNRSKTNFRSWIKRGKKSNLGFVCRSLSNVTCFWTSKELVRSSIFPLRGRNIFSQELKSLTFQPRRVILSFESVWKVTIPISKWWFSISLVKCKMA